MKPLHQIVLCVLLGVAFAVSYILRGHLWPGIVGGILAGILLYLVIGRFEEQTAQRRRDRER
jgi:ABC-type Mn2+/Zn2+ transport system permease subunit